MRRFVLERDVDATGISGTGLVAEGVQFSTGWCAMIWLGAYFSAVIYPNVEHVLQIHGHQGTTRLVWMDDDGRP